MTPAINKAKQAKIPFTIHEYEYDPAAQSYGREAAQKMGVAPERVYKTLVAADGTDLYVAVVPVMYQLDLKRLAKAVGAKKMAMADVAVVERVTGYVVGGVSPLGQKKRLRTVMDAGRRGMEIELSPQDLAALTGASFAPVAR
jgi:Cys-tRNA(Pro)/Cys-tRNA(Cys) deacylase